MDKQKEKSGIILMFLSVDKFDAISSVYHYVKDGIHYEQSYQGIQTGDAPVKFLLSEAAKDGTPINKIICIVTDEDLQIQVRGKYVNPENISTYERFCTVVAEEYDNSGESPEIIPVKIDMSLPSQERTRQLYLQITSIIEKVEDYNKVNVYLDYTGGFRDVSYLMTAIIQYLQYKGINCQRIIYSDYFMRKIYDLGYLYAMSDLINSVGEFLSTGNASRLLQVMNKSSEPDGSWINIFLKSIVAFSDALTLCNMQELDKAAEAVCECLEKRPLTNQSLGLYQEMLMTLVPEIQNKLHLRDGKISYPGLIHWCLDNRMLQQAVTLYVEKMPVFYFSDEKERALIPAKVYTQVKEKIRTGEISDTNWETTAFYTYLFDYIALDQFQDELNEFKEAVCRMSKEKCFEVPFKPQRTNSGESNPAVQMKMIRQNWPDAHLSEGCILAMERLESYVQRHIFNSGDCEIYERVNALNLNKQKLNLFLKDLAHRKSGQLLFMYPEIEYIWPQKGIDFRYRQKYAATSMAQDMRLRSRMLYYLAAKLIRNRMNHAAEEMSEDEASLSNYLKKEGIVYDGTISSIDKILRDGLKLSWIS